MQSSLAVRRADGTNAPSMKRSVKIRRPHSQDRGENSEQSQ
jgi:hypothetical protein